MKRATMIGRAAAILLVAMMGVATMYAQGRNGKGGRGHGMEQRMEKALQGLDLTDDQKSRIDALVAEFKEDNAATLERIDELSRQAREQMKDGDREAAMATREEVKGLRMGLKDAGKELKEQIAAVLTDDQKAQLQERREKRKEEGGKRGKKNRGGKGRNGGSDKAPATSAGENLD